MLTRTDGARTEGWIYSPRELALQGSWGGQTVTAGLQILAWGKSDGENPSDFFSPQDYSVLSINEEDRRLGNWGIHWSYVPLEGSSPCEYSIVVLPFFASDHQAIDASSVPFALKFSSEPLWQTDQNVGVGGKISYYGEGWDGDFMIYHGPQKSATLDLVSAVISPVNGSISTIQLEQSYAEQTGMGANWVKTFDDWIFRSEIAYSNVADSSKYAYLTNASNLAAVLGVEKPWGDDFRIQVQYLYKKFFHDDINHFPFNAQPQIAAAELFLQNLNQRLSHQQRSSLSGNSFLLRYEPQETNGFSSELFYLGYYAQQLEWFTRGQVSYQWDSGWKTSVGALLFRGSGDGLYGSLRTMSSYLLEVKYYF